MCALSIQKYGTRHTRFDPHTFIIISFIYTNVDLVCVRSKITDLLDMLCSSLLSPTLSFDIKYIPDYKYEINFLQSFYKTSYKIILKL
jgi:hypothetical protein